MTNDEQVLVIPTEHVQRVCRFQGFRPAAEVDHVRLLDPGQFLFLPRSQMETDERYQQLIPYIVLQHRENLFHYRRGASGTEKRLRAMRSVGIGGHISHDDLRENTEPYTQGLWRELHEEVTIPSHQPLQLLGFIKDDRTAVGRVHLGVAHRLELDSEAVRSNEEGIHECGFATLAELHTQRDEFETWSQLVIETLRTQAAVSLCEFIHKVM